jgi:hypothetical protein
MKKIIFLIILFLTPLVNANTDGTYHSAILGNNTIYLGKVGNLNLGLFFEERLSLTEEIFERLEWFNTDLFSATSTGGAISHLLLLFTVIGLVTIAEATVNPALMIMAGMAMFFFGWFILLTVSLMIGFFIFPFSALYMIRVPSIVRNG